MDEPVEWLWYGVDEAGETRVSFGRWQSHACQYRYKFAMPQATEHDHGDRPIKVRNMLKCFWRWLKSAGTIRAA